MSYNQLFCKQATSQQIKEQIEKYDQLWKEASFERGKAVREQNDSQIKKYDVLVIQYETLLQQLKEDLIVKEKEESKHDDTKERLQILLHELEDIIKRL
jgi:hypothetical protein